MLWRAAALLHEAVCAAWVADCAGAADSAASADTLVLTAPPHLVGTTLGSKPWAQAHPYCLPQHTSTGC